MPPEEFLLRLRNCLAGISRKLLENQEENLPPPLGTPLEKGPKAGASAPGFLGDCPGKKGKGRNGKKACFFPILVVL